MKRNFAIGVGSKLMAPLLEFPLNPLVVVEFTVYNDMEAVRFVGNRLIPGCKINDAQTSMTQSNLPMRCNPRLLAVRAAMFQTPGRIVERSFRNLAVP